MPLEPVIGHPGKFRDTDTGTVIGVGDIRDAHVRTLDALRAALRQQVAPVSRQPEGAPLERLAGYLARDLDGAREREERLRTLLNDAIAIIHERETQLRNACTSMEEAAAKKRKR